MLVGGLGWKIRLDWRNEKSVRGGLTSACEFGVEGQGSPFRNVKSLFLERHVREPRPSVSDFGAAHRPER